MSAFDPAQFTCEVNTVCEQFADGIDDFIDREESRYDNQILDAAKLIASLTNGCQIVWMCGPSSVGKTTTAKRLCDALQARHVQAFVVTLDDFYRGRGEAPLLPDGSYDYESPKALDLPLLERCVRELMTVGETYLPRFDFTAGKRRDEKTFLRVSGNTVVIFEGIQAFSPLLTEGWDTAALGKPLRVFINALTRFTDGDEVLLCRRDIRLSRRLLRDERTRGSDFAATMAMWDKVLAGEDTHIFPYNGQTDIRIDTSLRYEPCVIAGLLGDRLCELANTPYADKAAKLKATYDRFPAIPLEAVPADSVLREFLGRRA